MSYINFHQSLLLGRNLLFIELADAKFFSYCLLSYTQQPTHPHDLSSEVNWPVFSFVFYEPNILIFRVAPKAF